MNVYTATFLGKWIQGIALITARDKGHARRMLQRELDERKLVQQHEPEITLRAIAAPRTFAKVVILSDGEY